LLAGSGMAPASASSISICAGSSASLAAAATTACKLWLEFPPETVAAASPPLRVGAAAAVRMLYVDLRQADTALSVMYVVTGTVWIEVVMNVSVEVRDIQLRNSTT